MTKSRKSKSRKPILTKARPHRSDMSYEAALSILGSRAYDGDSD